MAQQANMTAKTSGGGIGFAGLLTIAFIVLKLTGVISWSWVWVLSPLWIGLALSFTLIVIVLILAALVAVFSKK